MCDMDVIHLRGPANILQATANCMPYLSASEEDLNRSYFSANNLYTDDDGEELCQLASSKSLDSLNTLLDKLPDIVIPEPVYSPLPLQCLAASSLPASVRSEIDAVLQEFSIVLKSPSHVLRHEEELHEFCQLTPMSGMKEQVAKEEDTSSEDCDADVDTQVQKSEEEEEILSDKTEVGERVALYQVVVERNGIQEDNVHDLGVGFRVTGGVKCPSCKTLHTVITSVSENYPNPVIREGMSVKEWNGYDLENCSYEVVKSFLGWWVESEGSTAELVVKKCRGNFVTRPRDDGSSRMAMLGTWQSMRRAKRPDLRMISKRQKSGNQSPPADSTESSKSRSSLEVADTRPSPPAPSLPPSSSSPRSSPHLRRANVPSPLSRSPSPSMEMFPKTGSFSPRNENETVVSIPRLESNARELSVRPRSPIATEDGHFSRFANGMVQLSMVYNSELEDLQVALCKVKGQSNKEIGDSSDVFINAYLIPDTRDQGVRSMCVNKSTGSSEPVPGSKTNGEESHAYILKPDELEESAIRLILWDATKSKKIIFRGEVLLSLSDSSVIPLTGKPTWFTVCPLDPNLPALPKPVHYKRQQRNALSRLVHKAQAITSTGAAGSSIKQSATLTEGFQQAATAVDLVKSGSGSIFSPKRHRKAKSGNFDNGNLLGMLKDTSVDGLPATRHTINEAKLAKLNSIISVLRQTTVDDDDDDGLVSAGAEETKKRESTPEFVNIFKKEEQVKEETKIKHENKAKKAENKKSKRKSRPPRTMLRAVTEGLVDVGHSSDSGDYDDGPGSLSLNEHSMAWLAARKNIAESALKRHSDPFQTIPTLRESLHAGKQNKVTTYMFDNPSEVQPTPDESLGADNSSVDSNIGQRSSQIHYKLVDTKAQGEEEEEKVRDSHVTNSPRHPSLTASHAVSSPDCKCYPVPVEVSVHRISIIDVDRQEQAKSDIFRTRSVDTRPVAVVNNEPVLARLESDEVSEYSLGVLLRPPSGKRRSRSRSLGDMELLSSDEEVLLVRTPCTGQQLGQSDESPGMPKDGGDHKDDGTDILLPGSPVYPSISSSLDSTLLSLRRHGQHPADTSAVVRRVKVNRPRMALSARDDAGDGDMDTGRSSWVVRHAHSDRERVKLLKHRSLDDLIDSTMNGKKSSKNQWKQNYLYDQGPLPGSPKTKEAAINGGVTSGVSIAGSAKLQLEYNDLNPKSPVLLVKLLDILLQSSKSLSSELVLKCHLLHSSTGVCILKNKTAVNIKNPLPSAPLGILQFQTDYTNLSLEISFLSLGKLFSGKKEIGRVSLDLNSLHLSRDSAFLEWVPIMKQAVA